MYCVSVFVALYAAHMKFRHTPGYAKDTLDGSMKITESYEK